MLTLVEKAYDASRSVAAKEAERLVDDLREGLQKWLQAVLLLIEGAADAQQVEVVAFGRAHAKDPDAAEGEWCGYLRVDGLLFKAWHWRGAYRGERCDPPYFQGYRVQLLTRCVHCGVEVRVQPDSSRWEGEVSLSDLGRAVARMPCARCRVRKDLADPRPFLVTFRPGQPDALLYVTQPESRTEFATPTEQAELAHGPMAALPSSCQQIAAVSGEAPDWTTLGSTT